MVNLYAEVDLEIKEKTIACHDPSEMEEARLLSRNDLRPQFHIWPRFTVIENEGFNCLERPTTLPRASQTPQYENSNPLPIRQRRKPTSR